jgi:hypothetical protein
MDDTDDTDDVDGTDDGDDTTQLADVHDIAAARERHAEWSDDYIDEQLDDHDAETGKVAPSPTPMSRFRHGSLGVTLGAAMTGLGNVLEPRKKEEAPVVFEHDEPDHSHDPVELRLDHDDPTASVFIIRPHERDERDTHDDDNDPDDA